MVTMNNNMWVPGNNTLALLHYQNSKFTNKASEEKKPQLNDQNLGRVLFILKGLPNIKRGIMHVSFPIPLCRILLLSSVMNNFNCWIILETVLLDSLCESFTNESSQIAKIGVACNGYKRSKLLFLFLFYVIA